jgi:hypothetical protein
MAALRDPANLIRPAKQRADCDGAEGLRDIGSREEATATDAGNFYCIFGESPHSAIPR